jgi:hypothetical protein
LCAHAVADAGDPRELVAELLVDYADIAQFPQVSSRARLVVRRPELGQLEANAPSSAR